MIKCVWKVYFKIFILKEIGNDFELIWNLTYLIYLKKFQSSAELKKYILFNKSYKMI